MRPFRPGPPEKGQARVEFAPHLELSLSESRQLAALIDGWAGVKGVTVHWQADRTSPEVCVKATDADYEHALDQLLAEVGGFCRVGSHEDSFAERPEKRIGRALVVSSDYALRECAVMYLAVMGFEVDDLSSGRAAQALIQKEEYDLLIVGSVEPVEGGMAGLLGTLEPYLDMTTPVIFWTGAILSDAIEIVQHLRAPLIVLSKPNDFSAFREKVMRALEWRHLVRLRRRVREHVDEVVAMRVADCMRDVRAESERVLA
jgi:FixJ family two-component response regulator